MAYQSEFQLHPDYLRVFVSGARRSGDAAFEAGKVGREIVQTCEQNGVYRILLVLNLTGRLSAVDSYEMVVDAIGYGWNHRFKMAMVDTNVESADDVRFTETVAINRWYDVRAFTSEKDALAWLLDGPQRERAIAVPDGPGA